MNETTVLLAKRNSSGVAPVQGLVSLGICNHRWPLPHGIQYDSTQDLNGQSTTGHPLVS